MVEILNLMNATLQTPRFDFYSQLFYFLKQEDAFPLVATVLERKFEEASEELSLPRASFEALLTIHKSSIREIVLAGLLEFVFKDVVCLFQDTCSLDLFAKFLSLAGQENHLYMMHLKPDPQLPIRVVTIVSNPKFHKEHNRTVTGGTLHVFHEE